MGWHHSHVWLIYLSAHLLGNCLGSNLARERSNSLTTTRNRTTSDCSTIPMNSENQSMPPPRTIPLAISNRPHSMYANNYRLSHSPPVNNASAGAIIANHVNAAPMSPSTGCSESDGSSLSIDETDGCFHSLTPDDVGYGLKYFRFVPYSFWAPELKIN